MARRKPTDAFAVEMAQLAEDRRMASIGTFREEWAERLKRPVESHPYPTSLLHLHDDDCFGEPEKIRVLTVPMTVLRCRKTGAIHEVRA